MRRLRIEIETVARADSNVLVTGETGVGKSLVAREIHRLSDRRNRRFVHVDCAALAAAVIESELFGHERGAFTGAVGPRPGRFQLADGGTLFLDEIGDLDVSLQAKLLRALQEREYERVGGTATLRLTARVVAATSCDLHRRVSEGLFRADLLFRLSVYPIEVPPLRDRLEDVPELVCAAGRDLEKRLGVAMPEGWERLGPRLCAHPWPGNVRELLNLLERLALRCRGGELDPALLDGWLAAAAPPPPASPALRRWSRASPADRAAIAAALSADRGNVSRAARRLGLARSTLRYRMQLYGL